VREKVNWGIKKYLRYTISQLGFCEAEMQQAEEMA